MALTNQQDIPEKPRASEPWTFRRLFPFKGAISVFTKTFTNPFDMLLGYLVVILSIAEVFGRRVSWFIWILTFLIFIADLAERRIWETREPEKKPEEVK